MALCDVREGKDNVSLDINSFSWSKEVLFLYNYKRGEVEFRRSFYRRSREVNQFFQIYKTFYLDKNIV